MKHTWRFCLTAIILLVNYLIFSLLDIHQSTGLFTIVYIANVSLGWIVGFQLDKFVLSKNKLTITQSSLNNYTFALDSVPIGVGITNELGLFEYVNKAHQNLYGYSSEEILRMNWRDCYSVEVIDKLNKAVPSILKYGHWQGHTIGVRKNGSTFPQDIHISRLEDTNKFICVVRDITEQQQYLNNMKYIAEHDILTKLPNRRKLLADIHKCEKESVDLSLLFIDLDRFKMVNDTLGHNYGDELLIHVAKRLASVQDNLIKVYHLGGDEFIVLLKDSNHGNTEKIAVQIISLFKEPYFIFGKEVTLTTSIGICRYSEHTDNYNELIKLADTAMYLAKLDGKNNYKFFNDKLRLQLERESLIENELRKAILNNEFFIHYQPKCNLTNSTLVGVEALIRWINPILGVVSPAEFIPIAEKTGLIDEIGKWMIKNVVVQMNQWELKKLPLVKISVNVSQRQFKDNYLVDYIATCLATHKIKAHLFEIEITESLLADFNLVIPQLTVLKNLGVGISIDDFGTGYSSLNFIHDLPIDTIKIDQSYIKGINNNKNSLLVKAIIDIGNTLNLDVVAEGIESEQQLHKLMELNCTIGQGYFLSKPLDALEIEPILKRISFQRN